MNWKNINLEPGFVKQENNLNGSKTVNYIPIEQIDSFGVVSSENKRWLYAGVFMCLCTLVLATSGQGSPTIFSGILAAGLIAIYFLSRKTWFTVVSSQTKISVEVMTTKEEIQAVNDFVLAVKQSIQNSSIKNTLTKAA